MEDKLKQFVQEHRQDFDSHEPPPGLWSRLENGLKPKPPGKRAVYRMMLKAVAAAVVIFLAGTGVYYLVKKEQPQQAGSGMAVNSEEMCEETGPDTNNIAMLAPDYAGQVYQFAALIENRQQELKTLTADDTSFSKQFEKDFYQLDSSYMALKAQLPGSPGREALLQALIYNLELQLEVLNHQLNLIRDIQNTKNNENANSVNKES
jgi:hypothetical protein